MFIYSNSPLVNYTKLSPNKNLSRQNAYYGNPNGVIDTITIHHMAGNLTIETCGELFADPRRQGSSNYGIGTDGRIGLYVEEAHRAWTSSSGYNDYRAVTIEVANDGGENTGWHVSDKAIKALINLCVDICLRNNIECLRFTGDASGNLTMHQYFCATACPGPYLKSQFSYIANAVNERLQEVRPLTNKDWEKINAELVKRDDTISKLKETLEAVAKENKALKISIGEKTQNSQQNIESIKDIKSSMGGKEAVAMLNDLQETGDFKGGTHGFNLSAQMVRMMLIFYRLIKRVVKINNLKWD